MQHEIGSSPSDQKMLHYGKLWTGSNGSSLKVEFTNYVIEILVHTPAIFTLAVSARG